MLSETIEYLNCQPGQIVVDCTLGGCGHSMAICRKIGPDGLLIGLDQDAEAIAHAREVLESYGNRVRLFHSNFSELGRILSDLNIAGVHGIVMDLGMSRHHLEGSRRGFSFQADETLDMRMDVRSPITAADILRTASETELADIFHEFGEERYAKRIARVIVRSREHHPIDTTSRLSAVVCEALPAKARYGQPIHPATRVFMALRIAVNRELEKLEAFLEAVPQWLLPGGRLCVLSFHSLEDRIVKRFMRSWEGRCVCPPGLPVCTCNRTVLMHAVFRHAMRPTEAEIIRNPLSRSTRLRVAEKR
jgi:16S rRNA (cytosine1402-N4)-methyltransferase